MTALPSPQHETLTANTVVTITFDQDFAAVEILNVDGAEKIYATVDGTTPGIAATGSIALPAAIGSVEVKVPTAGNTVVKLKSVGTPKVQVRGL